MAGPVPNSIQCGVCGVGRFTDGMGLSDDPREDPATFAGWLLRAARVESIAAVAFDRLADELAAWGAPESLVRGARESAEDERGHASIMARFAAAEGLEAPAVAPPAHAPRSLESIALENAAEGCVRETLGAVVMAWQAEHAADPALRAALSRVAEEESRHAAWSWELDAWARSALPPSAARRMDEARAAAIAELTRDMALEPAPELAERGGMPRASAVRAMLAELHATVWQA
jgi:rubrerythrin